MAFSRHRLHLGARRRISTFRGYAVVRRQAKLEEINDRLVAAERPSRNVIRGWE
jgi:hypothetical protein